jgi:O-antigen/teichoic acid export membrane protein
MKRLLRDPSVTPAIVALATEAAPAASVPGSRFKHWAGLLTRFLSLEVLIQAVTFATGVLLIRVLPKAEYAYFTIANTMQQMMNTLADNGVGAGLTSIGGRVWDDRTRFGQLLNTAMRLRRVLALIAVLVVTPILAWMLTEAGARPGLTALLCAAVLLGLYFQLTIGVLTVGPLLYLESSRVQTLHLGGALLRLALIVAAYLVFLNALVAVLAAAASFALQEFLLRRWRSRYAETTAPQSEEYRKEIVGIVKSQAPNAIYYCIQSQLTVWLISVFGSTHAVAEVGALGRIGMIFLMLSSVMTNVVMPRFARVHEATMLWRRYWQIIGGLAAALGLLLLVAAAFPEWLLWILGPRYTHLEKEVFLMILGTVLWSILGTMYQLNLTRGWVLSPWQLIPIGLATEILLIVLLDVSQVHGVLLMAAYSTLPGFFLNFWRTRQGIRAIAAQANR